MSADLPLAYEVTCPAAPVQIEGTVAGRPFYFRARHDEWRFAVAEAPGLDPVAVDERDAAAGRGWLRRGDAAEPGAASWIPIPEAEGIVRACAAEYVAERGGTVP